ncbi:MAG: hypothetical protein ABI831_04145 [Betaproteobacteria bacterium]
MRRKFLLCGLVALLMSLAVPLLAAPGFLDRSFGAGFGYVRYGDSTTAVPDQGSGVAVQADGKVVVAGTSGLEPGIVVLRYNTDGTLDDAFADAGVFRWKRENEISGARRVVALPDGRLLVFGFAGSAAQLWLARLLPDGALDPTFGTNGITLAKSSGWSGDPRRVVIDEAGRLVIVWEAADPTANKFRISRYTAAGKVDEDYNFGDREVIVDTRGYGEQTMLPFTAAFDPFGRLLVFASAFNVSSNTTLIYRFARDTGYPDASFGINGVAALPQLNFAFYGRQWTVLPAGDSGFVLVEWMTIGVQLQKLDFAGRRLAEYGTPFFPFPGGIAAAGNAVMRADGSVVITGTRRPGQYNDAFVLGVTADGTLDKRLGALIPQRTYRAEDLGGAPGLVAADIATTAGGMAFALAGSTANLTDDDIMAMRLDAVGNPVAGFGGTGRVAWNGGDVVPEAAQGIWRQADGKLLTFNRAGTKSNWRRFLSDGRADTGFGTGGKRLVADDWSGPNVRILGLDDGSVLIARQQSGTTYTNVTRIVRYHADGTTDASFGAGGALTLIDEDVQGSLADEVRPGLAQLPDGRLLIATYGTDGLRLRRTMTNGAPDMSFGNGTGIVYPPLHGRPQAGYVIALQADGKILMGAGTTVIQQLPLPVREVNSDVLVRLMPDGSLDPTFGLRGGIVPIQIEDARDPQILRLIALPDDTLLVAGNITSFGRQQFFFMRVNADGSTDTSYGDHTDGADGPGPFIWSDVYQTGLRDATLDALGRLVITGDYKLGAARVTAFVVRFLDNGTIDGAFGGINQHIFLFDRPEALSAGNALALDTNGIIVGGQNGPQGLIFKLEADGSAFNQSLPVIEFYNALLNHYFITADANEIAAVDGGAAGPGWQRTGKGFRGWLTSSGLPVGAAPVCRFYGVPGFGPNSHFYTIDPTECDAVRADPGWRFEGIAFYSIPPFGSGGCPTGMQSVYRLYNNRFAVNDSNHRYTTDLATYNAMQRQGWLPEGVVMCSPTR